MFINTARVKVDALLHHSFDFSNIVQRELFSSLCIVTRKNVCVVQYIKLGHGNNRVCALSVCIHKDAVATEDF